LVLAAAVRFWLVFTAQGINNDAFKYARTATRMAERGVLSGMRGDFFWPYYPVNRRLVVYPFLGSLIYRAVGRPILSLRLVSALSGIALVWVLYVVVKELFKQESIALLSAGLVAFHPEFAKASASVYREVLMAFLLVLGFLLLLRTVRKDSRWPLWSFFLGLLVFTGFLTRPDGAAAGMAFGVIVLFVAPAITWKRRLAVCAVMAMTFLALEVPYALWLKNETGYWLVNQWQIQRGMNEVQAARRFLLKEGACPDGTAE